MQGVTAYQVDYSMAALTVRAAGSPLQPPDGWPFNLPMASLEGRSGMPFWRCCLRAYASAFATISLPLKVMSSIRSASGVQSPVRTVSGVAG